MDALHVLSVSDLNSLSIIGQQDEINCLMCYNSSFSNWNQDR